VFWRSAFDVAHLAHLAPQLDMRLVLNFLEQGPLNAGKLERHRSVLLGHKESILILDCFRLLGLPKRFEPTRFSEALDLAFGLIELLLKILDLGTVIDLDVLPLLLDFALLLQQALGEGA
jgi:hypothetical protein